MSTTRRSSESPISSIQLLGMFLISLLFFAAAVIGGFLAGYQRGILDQALASSPGSTSLMQTLLGDTSSAPSPENQPDPPPQPALAARPAPAPQPQLQHVSTRTAPAPQPQLQTLSTRPAPTADSIAQTTHLQVSAGPQLKGAQRLAGKLAAKGYPAAVYSGGSDGLHRVILGPCGDRASAKAMQARLKADGFNSLIRVR